MSGGWCESISDLVMTPNTICLGSQKSALRFDNLGNSYVKIPRKKLQFTLRVIRGTRLLGGGAYSDLSVSNAVLIRGMRLFEARRLLQETWYLSGRHLLAES